MKRGPWTYIYMKLPCMLNFLQSTLLLSPLEIHACRDPSLGISESIKAVIILTTSTLLTFIFLFEVSGNRDPYTSCVRALLGTSSRAVSLDFVSDVLGFGPFVCLYERTTSTKQMEF